MQRAKRAAILSCFLLMHPGTAALAQRSGSPSPFTPTLPSNPAPRPPRSAPQGTSFDVEVSLVVIDVVVTDRDGKHVQGLKAEDFELYEEGSLQEITDFSEEGLPLTPEAQIDRDVAEARARAADDEGGAAAADGRWFVIFFDESNMTPNDLAGAREAAREFVRYEIFGNDRVAVLSYGGSLRLMQDFTSDVDALARSLYTEGSAGQQSEARIQSQIAAANNSSGTNSPGLDDATDAGAAVQSDLIRFQDAPDVAALESAQTNERLYKAIGLVGKTLAKVKGRKTMVMFSRGFNAVFADHGLFAAYREMVNSLNGANVAIYPIDSGRSAGKAPGDASRAGGAQTLDLRTTASDAFRSFTSEQISSLKVLAADTGGVALVGGSDLGSQLRKMAYSTSSYYLLGYTPSTKAKGSFRDIKVKVKRSGVEVLARKGYYSGDEFASLSRGSRKAQLEDALLSWVEIHDLPVQLRTEFYPTSFEKCVLGIELALPRGILATDDAGARAEVRLYVVREESKRTVEDYREEVVLSSEDSLRELRYVKALEVKPGSYWLKTVLRDNVSGTLGTASAHVVIPEFEEDRPIVSSLVLMVPEQKAKLVAAKEGGDLATKSFQVAGQQLYPSPDNLFPPEGEVVCFFRVTNLKVDPETRLPRMSVRYTISRGGVPISQQTVHYRADAAPDPRDGVPIHVRVPVGGLGEGTYRLEVSAYDVLAAKGMKSDVDFTVVPGPAPAAAAPAEEPPAAS